MRATVPVLFLLLAACSNDPSSRGAQDAMVRLPAVSGNPGAAYFTVKAGAADETLVEVGSPQAIRAELHESGMKGSVMSMKPITAGVRIPAGSSVAFAPGGKHVMLFDINPEVEAGETMTLILRYSDAPAIEVQAKVVAAGDAMPGHDH